MEVRKEEEKKVETESHDQKHHKAKPAGVVKKGCFELDKHFYTKVLKCV